MRQVVANTADLGLENTAIELLGNGAVKVDDYCETTVPGVYAVGDKRWPTIHLHIARRLPYRLWQADWDWHL